LIFAENYDIFVFLNINLGGNMENNFIKNLFDPEGEIEKEIINYFNKINNNILIENMDAQALGEFLWNYFNKNQKYFGNNAEFFMLLVKYIAVNAMNPKADLNTFSKMMVGLLAWESHHDFILSNPYALSEEEQKQKFTNLFNIAQKQINQLENLDLNNQDSNIKKFVEHIEKNLPKNANIFTPFASSPMIIKIFEANKSKLGLITQAEKIFNFKQESLKKDEYTDENNNFSSLLNKK
jgi:hypothetical protein